MQAPEPRLTIPLLLVRADMYEQKRSRSFAVLLDRDTEVDYVAELVTALERGGDMSSSPRDQAEAVWQSWVRTFVDLGGIDIESPAFLDHAFASTNLRGAVRVRRRPRSRERRGPDAAPGSVAPLRRWSPGMAARDDGASRRRVAKPTKVRRRSRSQPSSPAWRG
jgi:hypothetical protein